MASNSKSLEEMLSSEVDESAISALVGSLETQLERPMTQDITQMAINSVNNVNHLSKANIIEALNSNTSQTIISNTNNNSNNNNNNVNNSLTMNTNNNLTQITTNSETNKRIIINNNTNNNNLININMNSNINNSTNLTNSKLMSSSSSGSLPGALPASGYINQVNNSQNVSINSIQGSIPANQILSNAIKVSAMPNGSPNSTSIQHTLHPTQQQLSTIQSTTRPSNTIALSAITPSLVITQNKTTAVGKPGQTLLIATTKDGPMLVQPSNNPIGAQNINNSTSNSSNNSNDIINTSTVTPTSTVVTIASRNIVSSANSSGPQNLMQQLVNQHNSNPIQFQLVTNVNTSRPLNNANIGQQKTLAPRVVQLPHNVRLTPQVIRPGSTPGFAGQSTITLPSNLVRAGTIFVKTENGQVHMVNVAPQINQTSSSSTPPNIQNTTTYRLQVPASAQTNVRNLGPNQHIVLPVSMANALQNKTAQQSQQLQVSQPLTIQTTAANAQSATTPSQMSPNTAKKKCKNFLSTLIRLASDQPDQVANNVKNLIQGLIDDAIQPEDFTNQLQKELNSSPQPCLVPFLRKSLPYLRYSLMQKELTIEGVRPPPHGAVSLPPQSQAIPQIQIAQTPRPGLTPTVRLLTPVSGLQNLMGGQTTTVLTPFTQTASTRLSTPHNIIRTPTIQTQSSRPTSKSSSSKSRAPVSKDKEKKNNFSSSLRDDDDINDVAAMGGVNLQEESQRILASNAEIVGQQIRSCKDENFLFTTPLHTRINKIANKYGLEDVSPDVVALVSHAVQERLKTLVEKLGVIAEHRQEQLKNDQRYEVLQDVKGQIQFLQELDRIEKRKHEEQEREVLIKAAKSRSKADDPDHLAIKLRAKEMQRQEMEELRQKEANETALQAIGNPKKRLKTSFNSITPTVSNTFASSSSTIGLNSSPFSSTPLKPMKRIKRVTIRDLHFLMEQEKETVRTPMLYRAYAK